jgi:hypothetical protein
VAKLIFVVIFFISFLHADKPFTDSIIQGRLNIVNGYSAECVMHKLYTNSGWTRIEGQVGRNGIDGLYYKKHNGIIKEVLVAESKWNKSKLGKSGKNKLINQMSQQWVWGTLQKLQKYKPMPEYASIKKLVKNDQYRARLFRMYPKGSDKVQIHIFEIKNKGSSSYDIKILNKLKPITMGKPKNRFQEGILSAYNDCRSEALHKYFPMLSDNDISILLVDNYLQKNDVKPLIKLKL